MGDIVGVIVAKKDSKRLPGKTFLEIGGRSLLERKIGTIRDSSSVDRVVVGTNSERVRSVAVDEGCEVLWRDEYHCDESRCSANEMIYDMVSRIDAEVIVWLHLTNPLVLPATIGDAVAAFLRRGAGYDSLCSVQAVNEHFWFKGRPLNFNPWGERHPLAGELEPYYMQNGAIFIQPREAMVENRYFYGERPVLFEMDKYESVDINEYSDLLIAEAYFRHMCEQGVLEG